MTAAIRHPRPLTHPNRAAFVLGELLALVVLLALLAALLLVAMEKTRRTARLGDDLAKFRFIAAATSSYAADFTDHVWSLSWQAGVQYDTPFDDIIVTSDDRSAAAFQAIYLIRIRTGRTDIFTPISWIPYPLYNHLVLVEYLDTALPDSTFISSADKHRQDWANDPVCFDWGCFLPYQPQPTNTSRHWPYSASFSMPAAFWDQSEVGSRVTPSTHNTYWTPSTADLRPVFLTDVAFPSQKAFLSDSFARHFGQRAVYATHEEARLPILFADGSARVKAAAESNMGWSPNQPQAQSHTQFHYTPSSWEPPYPPGTTGLVTGRFRWTRGGLAGRDFGGDEIDTGQ